jgi:hypothetical protein
MDIRSPPTPLYGQTYPSFPSSWYQDATPDRPFYIMPPPPPAMPPVYSPPPQTGPPYGGATEHTFAVDGYVMSSPSFVAPTLTTQTYYALGSLSFVKPTLT